MNLEDFQEEMAKLQRWSVQGCLDHGCQINKPRGMGTNGGCRCTPRYFSEMLLDLAAALDGEYGRYKNWKKRP